jgi:hypothetical protein
MASRIARSLVACALVVAWGAGAANAQDAPPFQQVPDLPALQLEKPSPSVLAFGESISLGMSSFEFSAFNTSARPGSQGMNALLSGALKSSGTTPASCSGSECGYGSYSSPVFGPTGDHTLRLNARFDFSYARYWESQKLAYAVAAGLSLSPNLARNFDDDTTNVTFGMGPTLVGELRFYPMAPAADLMLLAGTTFMDGFLLDYEKGEDPDTVFDNRIFYQGAVGFGYGRVLNVSPSTRLHKIVKYLQKKGVMAGELPADVGDEILLSWYALRNEIGYFKHLAYAVKVMSDRGLLSRPLDLEETYAVLRIIEDGQLATRDQGWLAAAVFSMQILAQQQGASGKETREYDDSWPSVFLVANWSRLIGEDDTFTVKSMLYFDLGVMDHPFPWAAFSLAPQYTRYLYNSTMDPVGSFNAGLSLVVAGAFGDRAPRNGDMVFLYHAYTGMLLFPVAKEDPTAEFGASVAYTTAWNRGSAFRVGIAGGLMKYPGQDLGYYATLSAGITYGIAAGYFSRY